MTQQLVRIGTRESELAVWQADLVKRLLLEHGVDAELVYIKSDGDVDTSTPLYELGVQGIFTKTLDIALLHGRIDIAVHSMKDVPTQLAKGLKQAAVLKRASYKDILVYKQDDGFLSDTSGVAVIATSSIRRKAQWLHRYPKHEMVNLRGNVNTRLRKVEEHNWQGAIFAAAGLERINLRPAKSIDLEWMLPAPAQGAIMIVCRENDEALIEMCMHLNDRDTAQCTLTERDFLRALLGGCSTPISALCRKSENDLIFKGNVCSPDGIESISIEKVFHKDTGDVGNQAAHELLKDPIARKVIYKMQNG